MIESPGMTSRVQKSTKITRSPGLRPGPAEGAYSVPPYSLPGRGGTYPSPKTQLLSALRASRLRPEVRPFGPRPDVRRCDAVSSVNAAARTTVSTRACDDTALRHISDHFTVKFIVFYTKPTTFDVPGCLLRSASVTVSYIVDHLSSWQSSRVGAVL